MLPLEFREAFLVLALLYLIAGIGYLAPDILERRRAANAGASGPSGTPRRPKQPR
jgi:hypothetical protein